MYPGNEETAALRVKEFRITLQPIVIRDPSMQLHIPRNRRCVVLENSPKHLELESPDAFVLQAARGFEPSPRGANFFETNVCAWNVFEPYVDRIERESALRVVRRRVRTGVVDGKNLDQVESRPLAPLAE